MTGERKGGGDKGAAPRTPSFAAKVRRALRGDITLREAALEAANRGRRALAARRERAQLRAPSAEPAPARLHPDFARLTPSELLSHFRTRRAPKFFAGFEEAARRWAKDATSQNAGATPETEDRAPHAEHATPQRTDYFALREEEAARLVGRAREIAESHRWPLLGYGALEFSAEPDWLSDPASGKSWPLDYHRDVRIVRGDGSDIRVLWELNRLAHLNTLARAHAATGDPLFARESFRQLRHWRAHNPLGRGPNWACAMEVALRALNLLAAFAPLGRSPETGEAELSFMLALFDEHARHVRRNLEFSYLGTSNHYLSDVVGLLWLGVCLPELEGARAWRGWALRELRREMGKQVLPDGADAEASTGYHRFVTELFLHSFVLCRGNGIEIGDAFARRLRSMLGYTRAYLRPDGRAPLVGDTDSGQALPLAPRAADEHAHLLALGAVVFGEPDFKVAARPPEELFWMAGDEGVRAYEAMPCAAEANDSRPRAVAAPRSRAFPDAGTYVLREGDLYLLFSACGAGVGGRGSHGHNDSLAVEVSAHGTCFVRDPGTYVYTSDLDARHAFRSTAYHSTVELDGEEQNTTRRDTPFHLGNEAEPRVLRWETGDARDTVVAEHRGYARLAAGPVTHRRAVLFDKRLKFWLVEDALLGAGRHAFSFRFHLTPGLAARARPDAAVEVWDRIDGARLLIAPLDAVGAASLEPRFSSRDYGSQEESQSACWTVEQNAPLVARWALVPARAGGAEEKFSELLERLRREPPSVTSGRP